MVSQLKSKLPTPSLPILEPQRAKASKGSPGPPENVKVDEITDTTAQLSWTEVPEVIDGKTHTATVVELNPWVEYEFRVVASNKIGGGEPSLPSE
ncbi:hypothetical protein A6R68_02359, partial [Neotoma lepida]